MTAATFLRELGLLRAFRGEYMGDGLLEALEESGLLLPRLRIRLPDPIARRFWLSTHDEVPRRMTHPTEPDGVRWDAAVAFDRALHRSQNFIVHGRAPNPLDDPQEPFSQFIEQPSPDAFVPHRDRRVDVSNDIEETLFTDNFDDRYSTWQLLLAAEQAEAGVAMRINFGDERRFATIRNAMESGRLPEGVRFSYNFQPVHAAREFKKHEKALDAVVWFAEERGRALNDIVKGQGGRFRLSAEQARRYDEATLELAVASCRRFDVDVDALVALIRYCAKRWSDWDSDGRLFIAEAYKDFVGAATLLVRRRGALSFVELRDRVGVVGGWHKPVLDLMWPDWAKQEMERVSLTLHANPGVRASGVTHADIEAFVEFLANEGLEAFFWRLKSFEDHALRGNEFAIEAMKSDIQGMAVVVEHVATALGSNKDQLYEQFKQLWSKPDVAAILKRGDVAPLARKASLADDWPALKAKIEALRAVLGGDIAADLVMAHRIRGGVHSQLPEDDQLELEALFTGLMRAALLTFVEARSGKSP